MARFGQVRARGGRGDGRGRVGVGGGGGGGEGVRGRGPVLEGLRRQGAAPLPAGAVRRRVDPAAAAAPLRRAVLSALELGAVVLHDWVPAPGPVPVHLVPRAHGVVRSLCERRPQPRAGRHLGAGAHAPPTRRVLAVFQGRPAHADGTDLLPLPLLARPGARALFHDAQAVRGSSGCYRHPPDANGSLHSRPPRRGTR